MLDLQFYNFTKCKFCQDVETFLRDNAIYVDPPLCKICIQNRDVIDMLKFEAKRLQDYATKLDNTNARPR
jgi:hypothetical protein